MSKFKNKYRVESTRKSDWDYGLNAFYFITICTKNRVCFFGDVREGGMQLSEIGKLAEKYWLEIPQHFSFTVLHNHIIMPNHVHGIIEIAKRDDVVVVETQNFASLQYPTPPLPSTPPSKNQFGPQSQNLASIVRGFKIGVTKNARPINPEFEWQARYHDHIIRNDTSFQRISHYIINNPSQWTEDRFHPNKPKADK